MQPDNQQVTHTNAATNAPLESSTTLLQEVPPSVWAFGLWLLWAVFHWQSALPAMIVGWFVWSIQDKSQKAREAAARVAACANVCCPQVVFSTTPYESPAEVSERAKRWREDLKASGNLYWEIIPIIEYPFNPMIYGVGQLTFAWDIYRRQAGEVQHNENIKWVEGKCPTQLKGSVLSQIVGRPEPTEP